jgi:ubiquitin-like-conjugating enzyme ATG3
MQFMKNAREWLTPVLQESAFLERGVLTPEEFVRAGDQLVSLCPSWQWGSGEPGKIRSHLPPNKQFLFTKRVPSYRRVAHLSSETMLESIVDGDGLGEDWQAPSLRPATDYDSDEEALVEATEGATISDAAKSTTVGGSGSAVSNPAATSVKPAATAAVNDEYADMEDESAALDAASIQPAPATSTPSSSSAATASSDSAPAAAGSSSSSTSDNLLRARRYDVSITYDKYYQTPRFWLFGYDESGTPLEPAAIFLDVMQDYAQKTVTIENHPHLSRSHASIHPCQHAPAMKRIIDDLAACGKTPSVEQYLFIFLKFIQSVVPTIEYDYTMDVQVSASSK